MLFGKAEVMLPAFSQHHVDFKPGEFSRKNHAFQTTQAGEHELLAEREVLQQQLIAAKAAAALRPQVVVIAKSQRGEIPVERSPVHIARHPQPEASNIHGKCFMHGAGKGGVGVEIEWDLAKIDTAPVGKRAAAKAQADNRTPVRIGRQAGVL